ncbi:MAG: hypothetical protein CVV05_00385 [Gammaproteobacteria bacterium HGW-Gammaproteobacteria-1]|jgi:hypothetical protein|nr:MAG: hypothetical protein CVV05_00385 [Gammaproteobacteria bacterium HGW-Gammaproteobacteria-1]
MAIYHYTTGARLHDIAKSGVLRTFPERPADYLHGVVWLTKEAEMERSVLDKDWRDPEVFAAKYDGLYRFVVQKKLPIAIYGWHRLTEAMGLHWRSKKNLAAWAVSVCANPSDWLGVLQSIPLEYVTLERFEGNSLWRPVALEEALNLTQPPLPLLIDQGPRFRHKHVGASFR